VIDNVKAAKQLCSSPFFGIVLTLVESRHTLVAKNLRKGNSYSHRDSIHSGIWQVTPFFLKNFFFKLLTNYDAIRIWQRCIVNQKESIDP